MQEKFSNRFALGIIDKDKKEVPYLQKFELVASNDSLFVYKHKSKHHYIIQITPAIERFFIKAASELGVDLASYGFSSEMKELTRVTKQVSDKNEAVFKIFKKLFRDLSNAPEMVRLTNLIQYLGENRYDVELGELERIVSE
jgi:predicted chitinase